MDLLFAAYFTLMGLVIGSFMNVLIYRIPRGIPVSRGYSFCPQCERRLGIPDLVPLLSYVFLGAKCRRCKNRISPRYPLVEAANAVCYYLLYHRYGLQAVTLVYAVVCSCLITLAFIDFDYGIIPDRFHIIIGICAVAAGFLQKDPGWLERIVGAVIISVPALLLVFLTGGMGEGDVKLFAVCGILLGWKQMLLMLLLSSVGASLYGVFLMLKKRAKGKSEIPFGPFISFAVIFCLLLGERILGWYLSFLGLGY